MHFQAFLLDGLVRWNENRAAAAVEGQEQPLLSCSGHLPFGPLTSSASGAWCRLVKDHTVPRSTQVCYFQYTPYWWRLVHHLFFPRSPNPANILIDYRRASRVEYLYSQTGKVLQDASVDLMFWRDLPPSRSSSVEDEGFEDAGDNVERERDPTIHVALPLPTTPCPPAQRWQPRQVILLAHPGRAIRYDPTPPANATSYRAASDDSTSRL
ncbi:hypothetical protein DPEC_G00370310 [Dallia pectoralis]|nr:hypothetical protein DPEC_G00370310 [Dallia pectoralis]